MLWLRALLFFVIAPGTVLGVVPWRLLRATGAPLAHSPVRLALGGVLVAIGLAGLAWCFVLFVRRGRGTPAPYDPPRALVAEGPYMVSRNPMYVCLGIVLVGEAIATGHAAIAWWALTVGVATFLFVTLYEEPTLREQFGAEYAEYCARVPRWLGWRRR